MYVWFTRSTKSSSGQDLSSPIEALELVIPSIIRVSITWARSGKSRGASGHHAHVQSCMCESVFTRTNCVTLRLWPKLIGRNRQPVNVPIAASGTPIACLRHYGVTREAHFRIGVHTTMRWAHCRPKHLQCAQCDPTWTKLVLRIGLAWSSVGNVIY